MALNKLMFVLHHKKNILLRITSEQVCLLRLLRPIPDDRCRQFMSDSTWPSELTLLDSSALTELKTAFPVSAAGMCFESSNSNRSNGRNKPSQ